MFGYVEGSKVLNTAWSIGKSSFSQRLGLPQTDGADVRGVMRAPDII
jgi:hypothetical protein